VVKERAGILGHGKKETKTGKRRRWLIAIGVSLGLVFTWHFGLDFFREEEKGIRRQIREAVERKFPDQAAKEAGTYGLHQFRSNLAIPQPNKQFYPTVILIHGLDDPGKVWMNLAPALAAEGCNVWEMSYPNDQPIAISARLFFDELGGFKEFGTNRISIVAHSMGGLVSREMLTNPDLLYIEKARTGEVPEVVDLIMVGTPNHGSELARFSVFTEFRDQWINATEGKGHWLKWILDGAGEAKIDLLPDSNFLTRLNSRPQPVGVKMSVIAGVASPWYEDDINEFVDSIQDEVSENEHQMLGELKKFLKSVSDSLGDGLVTVSSSRLDGVPHRIVRGTHLSMIRNVSEQSERIPPAVPLIVERLKQSYFAAPN
jgi:pimeloyl-ACP methyl ester carboxylesterase